VISLLRASKENAMTKKKSSIDLIYKALAPSALLILAGACGSSGPTKQLVSARGAYQQAKASGTQQLAPMRMEDARAALDAAERAHKKDPGSNQEANLAYVAERKSQIAMASGKTAADLQEERILNSQYQAKLEQKTRDEQARMREQEAMQQPTVEVEEVQPDPFAELRDIATIRQAPDGSTVITLSSAVLFPTNEAQLSGEANQRLDKVAEVLSAQPKDTQIKIVGFTDATGTTATNEALSKRRADAVSKYLAQHGVDESMLQSIGRGEADPIASNATEDGRAINRRAELVIKLPEGQTIQKKAQPNSSAKTPEEKEKTPDEGMSPNQNDMAPKNDMTPRNDMAPKTTNPPAPQPPEVPEQ